MQEELLTHMMSRVKWAAFQRIKVRVHVIEKDTLLYTKNTLSYTEKEGTKEKGRDEKVKRAKFKGKGAKMGKQESR